MGLRTFETFERFFNSTFETFDRLDDGAKLLEEDHQVVGCQTFGTFEGCNRYGYPFACTPSLEILKLNIGGFPRTTAPLCWQSTAPNGLIQPLSTDAGARQLLGNLGVPP